MFVFWKPNVHPAMRDLHHSLSKGVPSARDVNQNLQFGYSWSWNKLPSLMVVFMLPKRCSVGKHGEWDYLFCRLWQVTVHLKNRKKGLTRIHPQPSRNSINVSFIGGPWVMKWLEETGISEALRGTSPLPEFFRINVLESGFFSPFIPTTLAVSMGN